MPLVSSGGEESAQFTDIGPKSEWVDANQSASVDVSYDVVGGVVIVAIQRPRGVTSLSLTIVEARARFLFFPWTSDNIAAIQQHLQIPIRFKASAL